MLVSFNFVLVLVVVYLNLLYYITKKINIKYFRLGSHSYADKPL